MIWMADIENSWHISIFSYVLCSMSAIHIIIGFRLPSIIQPLLSLAFTVLVFRAGKKNRNPGKMLSIFRYVFFTAPIRKYSYSKYSFSKLLFKKCNIHRPFYEKNVHKTFVPLYLAFNDVWSSIICVWAWL